MPLPLEDDDPTGAETLSVEDPEDQEQTFEYKEYCPHWESLQFRHKTLSQEAYQFHKHKSQLC